MTCRGSRLVRTGFAIAVALIATSAIGCSKSSPPEARFVRQVDWAGKGTWIKADTHIHTTFSDGSNTVDEIIAKSKRFNCEVLAFTDHADRNLKAATPEYQEAISVARRKNPDLIIFAGLEWNVPPFGGDEHATVLIHPDLDEESILARFKEEFDDLDRVPHRAELADEALRWLDRFAGTSKARAVVIHEHPSRKRDSSKEMVEDMVRWRGVNDLVIGVSGAPGHQGSKAIGSFKHREQTIDRWDPAVARPGDAWDTLLARGLDVWAAHAPSDYHNDNPSDLNDYLPGAFSETWLYVPEKSHAGVLRAFGAGTFFGVHGHIAREVELTVHARGLPRPAGVGEVIELAAGGTFTVEVRCKVPPLDWNHALNELGSIEVIGITRDGAQVVDTMVLDTQGVAASNTVKVPEGGIVVRARGKRTQADGTSLLFYTNPIRIQ